MARVHELLASGRCFSFEFFPPKTDEAERALEKALGELEPLRPSFVSVTYGAGGSTRQRTREIVLRILFETSMTPMAHLTCVGHRRAELVEIVDGYGDAGVENILALAGDPPAAADFGVTQFFFRAADYFEMMEELAALGVDKPVVPGVMPVTNVRQVQRFAELSGAAFPADLAERLQAVADTPGEVRRIGVEVATELCRDLLDGGAPGLHFYTLNRSTATREIYANLGLGGSEAG
jgi:methylenetetrahydrofolate reductase (NADPH)